MDLTFKPNGFELMNGQDGCFNLLKVGDGAIKKGNWFAKKGVGALPKEVKGLLRKGVIKGIRGVLHDVFFNGCVVAKG